MQPSDFIKPIAGLSYYVAMIERRVGGFSADVDPSYTRKQIVDEVFEAIDDGRCVAHVKLIIGTDTVDVTHEIVTAALAVKARYDAENDDLDAIHNRRLAERDHAHDLRKHAQAAE